MFVVTIPVNSNTMPTIYTNVHYLVSTYSHSLLKNKLTISLQVVNLQYPMHYNTPTCKTVICYLATTDNLSSIDQCVSLTPISGNAKDLSQYDPGC